MNARAFTLVELLVVVAIVALLVGVLLPALGGARVAGMRAVSTSNLRQLQLANATHAHDHDDRYIAGAPCFLRNLERWHGTRAQIGEPFTPEGAPLTAYLEGDRSSEALRSCPMFEPTAEQLRAIGAGFERSCGGYGYNNAYVGTVRAQVTPGVWAVRDDTRGERSARFDQPTHTIGFATAAIVTDTLTEYSFVEPPYWPEYPGFRPDPSIHFRFGGRAPVVWLDGHASTETRDYTYQSGLYSGDPDAYGIGWFGTDKDNRLFDHD
ncbi:MAG: hypothetical protein Tsb0013_22250 [Phycisphaerales bacterium]